MASALVVKNGKIERARVAVNGVAPQPLRLHEVEDAVAGQPVGEATATRAADLALHGAKALRHNDYKLPLLRNLVRRALRVAEA